MAQFFQIHPDSPQPRLVRQGAEILQKGGVIAYPTDSCYALGCNIGEKNALERIRRIRQLDDKHNLTLVCRDLGEISTYAKVDNSAYRLIKSLTPGPYTFILKATSQVPRRLQHPKRKTIGLRVPNNAVALALSEALGGPIMSTTLILPGEELSENDPYEIREVLGHQLDLVIDGGYCSLEPTTVVHLDEGVPVVTRKGQGDTTPFE